VAVIGLGLRLWIVRSRLGLPDSDEVVVGLMARRLLHGHPTAFYLGQVYGGSQESFLVALVFSVVRSWSVALKVVPIALHAVASLLVWRIGRRMFGEAAGRVAGLLVWVGPVAALWLSTKEQAFYSTTLVLGLALLLVAVRLVERPSPGDAALAGLLGGLGWWANPQIAYFAVPALVWMLVRRPGLARLAWLAGCGALVGAAPWLYANVGKGFPSLHAPPQIVASTYPHRLHLFADPGVPIALGLRRMWTADWLVPWLAPALYVAVLLALAAAGISFATSLLRRQRDDGRGLLLLGCLCYPFVFALSSFAFYVLDARYLFFLWPYLALLVAPALADRWRQLAALTAVIVLSVAGVASMLGHSHDLDRIAPNAFAHPLGPLLTALDDHGVTTAFADYWAAYRIDLATDERVRATPVSGTIRDVALAAEVRTSPRPGYVLVGGSSSDQVLGASLRERGIPYQRVVAGDYVLYLPEVAVMPESVAGI